MVILLVEVNSWLQKFPIIENVTFIGLYIHIWGIIGKCSLVNVLSIYLAEINH